MSDPAPFRYRAFLSYSHDDLAIGMKLHAALESYRVPRELVGRPTPQGPLPARLRPIFRDRFDLEAGHSLREQVVEALRNSAAMIVVCSRHSAKSSYVNEEIRQFKMLGRASRIYPIIIDGEPGDPENECFPPNLSRVIGPDGNPTGETEEPLASDIRPQGDGEELAKLKLIAGLLGIDLDDLSKREATAQRRQKRRLTIVAGSMAILAVIAVVFGIVSWTLRGQLQAANQELQVALANEETAREEADTRRMEAEDRYAQALATNLQLVTMAATFNSVVMRQPFAVMQVNAKLANTDFNRFLTGADQDDAVWDKLVEVLRAFAKERPPELAPIEQLLQRDNMPRQWLQHAETIMANLAGRTGKPEYRAELEQIKKEIVQAGGQPSRPAPCVASPGASLQNMAVQQAPPCSPERLTPATAN